jgi:hypothetical protein
MSSDIMLDDQVVTVQGSVLLCQTADLVLDNEAGEARRIGRHHGEPWCTTKETV